MQEKPLYLHIFQVVFKWRISLLIVLLATGTLSSIVMLVKPNIYRANTIFYPASISIQKPVFTEANRNINYYGDDHDVDRMLSMATSLDTKQEMITELGLREHYAVEVTSPKSEQRLFELFNRRYKVIKTPFDAIKISFDDTNPNFAAKVANRTRDKVNANTQKIIKAAQADVLKNAEGSLKIIESQIDELNQKLTKERKKYGVYDTESQSQAFAILETQGANKAELDQRIQDYTEGLSSVKALEEQIRFASQEQIKYKSNLYRLKSSLESDISTLHIIQYAHPPLKKHSPRRSLYVFGSILLMAFVSIVVVLCLESLSVVKES